MQESSNCRIYGSPFNLRSEDDMDPEVVANPRSPPLIEDYIVIDANVLTTCFVFCSTDKIENAF
jgi:hypothetical protein